MRRLLRSSSIFSPPSAPSSARSHPVSQIFYLSEADEEWKEKKEMKENGAIDRTTAAWQSSAVRAAVFR